MQRSITGFHRDEENDWVAELDCGHGQHVRHKPPFFNRPWVETASGRNTKLGMKLDCVRCDRLEWPESLEFSERTPEWTDQTLPARLLEQHICQTGVWTRIHVIGGSMNYRVGEPVNRTLHLMPGTPGIIPPQVPHALQPDGPVRFHIEYYRLS